MEIPIKTGSKTELVDVTAQVRHAIRDARVREGICWVYVPHTTAAVTINENADPSVKADVAMVLNQIVPWKADYRHLEGNSPAHVKATLVGASEMIAISGGEPLLGTWQGIFFCEFDGPRSRKLHLHILEGVFKA
jgi:secondary thiamine-phosphate synthase enzyme